MRTTAVVLGWLIVASLAPAQPAPSGPPPTLKVAVSTKPEQGEIIYLETVTRAVPVQKEKVVIAIVNGEQVKQAVTVTEYAFVLEQRHVLINAAKSRVITPNGKQLPIDEVWKRLKKDTVFAISGDGNVPAQAFLRALSADTLVIIPPQQQPNPLPPPKKT